MVTLIFLYLFSYVSAISMDELYQVKTKKMAT